MRRAVAIVFLIWVFAAASLRAETFRNPYRLALPSTPGVLLHGDVNGDGIDDIVYGETTSPVTIHTLLGQGGGGYAPGPSFPLPAGVSGACRMADYNGDHRLDLACNSESGSQASVVYFAGNGDGSFGAPQTVVLPPTLGTYWYLYLIPTGDLNGDGVPDLFAANAQGVNSYPVLSDGSGGYRVGPPIAYFVPTTFLDVNGDGRLDALDANFNVALGNGDGSFGAAKASKASGDPETCAYGDLDGDGHPDAVCRYIENVTGDIVGAWDLLVYHGNPDGSFAATPEYKRVFGDKSNPYEDNGSIGTPTGVGDYNHDGIADILIDSNDGTTILYGKPGLTFGDPVHFVSNTYRFEALLSDPVSSFVADINGDGFPDFVATGPNGIYFSYGQASGIYKAAPAYEVTGIISFATTADFDGDGIPDIIASGDNTLAFSKGNGDGTFQPNRRLNTGAVHFNGYNTAMSSQIYRGDFNGDGKQDLLVYGATDGASIDPHYYVMLGNGDGSFQPIQQVGLDTTGSLSANLRMRDMNGDGRDDILQAPGQYSGVMTLELSNGDGTFRSVATTVPQEITQNVFPVQETVPAVADYDQDGKLDLVVGSRDNAYYFRGKGDGTFAAPVKVPIPHFASPYDSSMATIAGDFDGDGKADFAVLWGSPGDNSPIAPMCQIFVYYGNGDGTFSSPVLADTSTAGFSALAAGELNNDGRDELITTTSQDLLTAENATVLHGLANRTFLQETPYLAGIGQASLDIVDLNHDGFKDLVFSNGDLNGHGNSVTILMNEGNALSVSGSLRATPEPSAVGSSFTLIASLVSPDSSTLAGNVTFSIDGSVVGSAALSGNAASLVISNPPGIGSHAVSASWAGSSIYPPVLLTGTHVVAGLPTTLTLSQPAAQITAGDVVTITEVLASSSGSAVRASGSIVTTDAAATGSNTDTFSSAPLPTTGRYGYTVVAAGTHVLTGNYSGDGNYSASTGTLSFTVAPLPVTLTLLSAPNPANVGASVTLTATTQAKACGLCGPVSGSILFYDGSTFLGSGILDRTGVATVTTSFSTAGSHALQATYAGDASRGPATANATEQVVRANTNLTLTSSLNPSARGTQVTFTANVTANGTLVQGNINFFDLLTLIGSAPINASGVATFSTSALSVGTHTITANFGVSTAYNASSAFLQQVVTQAPTQTFLTGTPGTLYQHQSLTLTSTTTSSFPPAGQVQILDGGTLLGTSAIVNGQVVLTTSSLAPGLHTLTSIYLGDANTLPSSSAPVAVTVLPSDFILSSTPAAVSVETEHHITFTVTAQSVGDFADTLALSAAGLPAHMTMTFTPSHASVTSGGQTAVSVYLDTDDVIGFKSALAPRPSATRLAWLLLSAPLLLLLLSRRRSSPLRLLAVALLAVGAIDLSGCSGLYPASTPPGAYTIQIQAVGTTTGLSHILALPVNVTH